MDYPSSIEHLTEKLNKLLQQQEYFSNEIRKLKYDLDQLKYQAKEEEKAKVQDDYNEEELIESLKSEVQKEVITEPAPQKDPSPDRLTQVKKNNTPSFELKKDLEKFIGENLISKIGIALAVFGIAIGAKYSIENELISPLTRIMLGYIASLGLLLFGMKLKKKYENYSAVLVSGAMAAMYFLTYAAYGFYDLIPQLIAFFLMLLFTIFTVIAALNFNLQVIAVIGLVGAYALPFLLSTGSGQVKVLFVYMTIINLGIMILAIKKYWKALYYISFALTWLIYSFWYLFSYNEGDHFIVGTVFLCVFFANFYCTFLAYKLIQKEHFVKGDIVSIFLNSFIFYGIGYNILDEHEVGQHFLGLFTLVNAVIHFGISLIVYRQKLVDRNILYFIIGLVLVFITISIPVQMDGSWVSLFWAVQAAVLFWIGRTKKVGYYEGLSYPLMLLAFFSILQDWTTVYDVYESSKPESRLMPLFNVHFLSSVVFIGAFSFMNRLNMKSKVSKVLNTNESLVKIVSVLLPAILIIVTFFAFHMEISTFWDQLYKDSNVSILEVGNKFKSNYKDYDIRKFKDVYLLNYALLFFSFLSIVNIKKIRNSNLGHLNIVALTFFIFMFLTQGLYQISELRESYINQWLSSYYNRGIHHVLVRYISLAFLAGAMYILRKVIVQGYTKKDLSRTFEYLLHLVILWVASSEVIHWLDFLGSSQSYKFGLSILWATYSLLLIAIGIAKKKKYLRVAAIILLGITLMKLFFYDIAHLDTLAKTIVFVSLGVLLLIISFLYNKYKHVISDEESN